MTGLRAPPPTLRVPALADALSGSLLGALDDAALRGWLMQRRWFAAKGREPLSARIVDVVPLEWGHDGDAIARVEVDPGGGGSLQHYQLPLAVRSAGSVDPELPVLAVVEAAREGGVIVDGTGDAAFRRRLASAFAAENWFGDRTTRWIVAPLDPGGVALDAAGETRIVRGEQSNTSIIFGDRAILKLFRRLEPGMNPDVEIGRFLTAHARYPHTPRLLGTISFSWGGGEAAIAGMLQQYLGGSRDAWAYSLERLASHLHGDGSDFAAEAAELGRITRELHEALASADDLPDFAPEPADAQHVSWWAEGTRRSAESALELLEARLESLPPNSRQPAERLLGRHAELLERIDRAARAARDDPGLRIRHHGDYHLGQVLRTGEGRFVIIDFEGEPSRPLAERRVKHSALRDAAGMLRSFGYAAAVGAMEVPDRANAERAEQWERNARDAFLEAYFGSGGARAGLLPVTGEGREALISLFELEKVCYELSYELNNRPDWVWIPLSGIDRELHRG